MWSRYTAFWERQDKSEAARAIYNRAITLHLKRQPSIHLEFALFEESTGAAAHAEELYRLLLALAPAHLQAVVSFAQFCRRQGKAEAGKGVFAEALLLLKDTQQALVFLTVAYAQYCATACQDVASGRQAFIEGQQRLPAERSLQSARLQYERRFGGS
jgi:pre-mRNA-processing factor 39